MLSAGAFFAVDLRVADRFAAVDLLPERSLVTTVVFVVFGEVFCVVVVVLSCARTDMVDITIIAARVACSCFVMEPLRVNRTQGCVECARAQTYSSAPWSLSSWSQTRVNG